jgi:hypothetical protein
MINVPRLHTAPFIHILGEGGWWLTLKHEQSAIPGRNLQSTALKVVIDAAIWGCVSRFLPPLSRHLRLALHPARRDKL